MRAIDAAVCAEVAFAWPVLVNQPLQACAQPSTLMELSPARLMHTQVVRCVAWSSKSLSASMSLEWHRDVEIIRELLRFIC